MRTCLAFAALLLSGCASVTPFERAQIFARRDDAPPDGGVRIAEASILGMLDPRWAIITFFDTGTREHPRILVRRISGDRTRQNGIAWASSDSCTAILDVVRQLPQIEVPRFVYPLNTASNDPNATVVMTFDGAQVQVSMDARYEHLNTTELGASYSVGGNVDSPAGVWFGRMEDRLADCWHDGIPRAN